jgi:branched-subunit amino acid aminotransferase/4-amino-4-deoxychorismate lyase
VTEIVYLGGLFLPVSEASIPVMSRAVLYGEGLFETLRAYGGRLFALPEHLSRLELSAAGLGIPLPDGLDRARGVAEELLARNDLSDGVVRLTVLAGAAQGPESRAQASHLLVTVRGLPAGLDDERGRGVSVVTRADGFTSLAGHKSTSYLRNVVGLRGRGSAREVLFLDNAGCVLEGATSNVFVLHSGRLLTPPADGRILPGVARAHVVEVARAAGLEVREEALGPEVLRTAEGVLLTNSVVEVLPVVSLDGRDVGTGRPHPAAHRLWELYREKVQAEVGHVAR